LIWWIVPWTPYVRPNIIISFLSSSACLVTFFFHLHELGKPILTYPLNIHAEALVWMWITYLLQNSRCGIF
jgi:hypothetical protein